MSEPNLETHEPKHPPAPAAGRGPGLHVSSPPQRPAASIHRRAGATPAPASLHLIPRRESTPPPPSRLAPPPLQDGAHRACDRRGDPPAAATTAQPSRAGRPRRGADRRSRDRLPTPTND